MAGQGQLIVSVPINPGVAADQIEMRSAAAAFIPGTFACCLGQAAGLPPGNSRVHALETKDAWNEDLVMPAYPRFPLAPPPPGRQKGALGIFQLLGLGLLLLLVLMLLIVVVRSLFT